MVSFYESTTSPEFKILASYIRVLVLIRSIGFVRHEDLPPMPVRKSTMAFLSFGNRIFWYTLSPSSGFACCTPGEARDTVDLRISCLFSITCCFISHITVN
jgi:hypothetical protein